MKHLKIENRQGLFLRDGTWLVITEMTKEDLLSIAHGAIEEEDFEMDAYEEASLPNPAQSIIYKNVYGQLMDLHNRRAAFLEESRNIYKEAYNKYCVGS